MMIFFIALGALIGGGVFIIGANLISQKGRRY